MILFWIICALLVALALAFILPPLLQPPPLRVKSPKEANVAVYREELAEVESDHQAGNMSHDQYQTEREELELRLLEDLSFERRSDRATKGKIVSKKFGYTLAVALPLVAFLLYLKIGSQDAFSAIHLGSEVTSQLGSLADPSATMSPERIEQNVAVLAKRLERSPDDSKGWVMLARSYDTLGRYKDASDAFERAIVLVNNDPDLLAEYAYALSTTNGGMQGKPADLIQRALRLSPDNSKALALAGNAAFERKDYRLSIFYWEKLLHSIPSDSELARPLNERIAEAAVLAKMRGK